MVFLFLVESSGRQALLFVCNLANNNQATGPSNALLNDEHNAVFRFPLLIRVRKQGNTQTSQETPNSVIPGIGPIRVAHQVKHNISQFFDQRAVGLDVRVVGVKEVVSPRHKIAARGVGMGERD